MFFVVFIIFFSCVLAQNCDKLGVLLYEDMGCKPFYYGKTACPAKYTCMGVQKSPYCVFKGQMVKVDDEANATLAPPCLFGCFCQSDITFSCPIVDCAPPEPFTRPDCYTEQDFTKCCANNEICPTKNSTTCLVDGQEYKEGQLFRPKDTCWECICKKGWRGINEEPFCQRIRCGEQLFNQKQIQEACAPAYLQRYTTSNTLCCPSHWICPSANEQIKGSATSKDVCKFGKNRLKTGQFTEKILEIWGTPRIHLRCTCVIPPLLTCTEI